MKTACLEVRKTGAIGVFEWVEFNTSETDISNARTQYLAIHGQLETRGCYWKDDDPRKWEGKEANRKSAELQRRCENGEPCGGGTPKL